MFGIPKRSGRRKFRRVFILKAVTPSGPVHYIVRGAYFESWRGRLDINMNRKLVHKTADRILGEFVKPDHAGGNVDLCHADVVSNVHITQEGRTYDLYPVIIFLRAEHTLIEHKFCTRLANHSLGPLLLSELKQAFSKRHIA